MWIHTHTNIWILCFFMCICVIQKYSNVMHIYVFMLIYERYPEQSGQGTIRNTFNLCLWWYYRGKEIWLNGNTRIKEKEISSTCVINEIESSLRLIYRAHSAHNTLFFFFVVSMLTSLSLHSLSHSCCLQVSCIGFTTLQMNYSVDQKRHSCWFDHILNITVHTCVHAND